MKRFKIFVEHLDISEEITLDEGYKASSEKSKFGGYRAHLKNAEGKTSYMGSAGYKKPEHAKGEAQAYHDAYFGGPGRANDRAADRAVAAYRAKHKDKILEEVELDEAFKIGDKVSYGAKIAGKLKIKSGKIVAIKPNGKIELNTGAILDSSDKVSSKSEIEMHRDFVIESVELDEATTKYVIKHKKTKQVLSTHDNYADAKDEHSGLGPDKANHGIYKQTKKDSALANRNTYREEVELDEAKTDIYHKHMLKALGKTRLPKNHQYTSAIANNGDFVVKDGGGRTVGRITKGDHDLKK